MSLRIPIVDKDDNIVDYTTQELAHKEGRLHRESALILLNENNEILLQKRGEQLDFSAAGHVEVDENYKQAIVRETKEELGIQLAYNEIEEMKKKPLMSIRQPRIINHRFVTLFLHKGNYVLEDFTTNGEVEEIKFYSMQELLHLLINHKNKFTNAAYSLLSSFITKKEA